MQYDEQGFAKAEDGTRLFYGVRGRGPAIVLCDGLGCDGFAWKYLQPALARNYRTIHWHYRGHGRSGSPQDSARIDVPALARDLAAILDHLSLERAHLVGHSMGTQVVLELYRIRPEQVQSLILLCGSYGKVTHTFHGSHMLHDVLPRLIETVHNHRGLARAIWGRVPTALAYRAARLGGEVDAFAINEADFRRYWEHIALMDPDLFLAMLRLAGEHTAEDLLPLVRVPTLVIAAERDTFTPPALAKHMSSTIPGAEHVIVPGGSHAVPIEQPMVIEEAITTFLDRVSGVAASTEATH